MKHLADIKEKNKKNIIKIIHKNKKISKKRIALELGLSPSVLTKLCNELKKEELIVELQKSESSSVGRKETLMGINYGLKKIIGISVNHKETTLILADLTPDTIFEKSFPTSTDPSAFKRNLISQAKNLLKVNQLNPTDILGIGISLKGTTDGKNSLSGIWLKVVELKEELETALEIPVVLDNGVRCSALLENFNSGIKNFILIKHVKAGIGGAIMESEKLVYGESNCIADIGHIIIDPTQEYCPVCKRKGCLESLISYEKIIAEVTALFDRETAPILYEICEGEIKKVTLDTIFQAAEKGSITINKLLRRVAATFAIAIINIYSIIDINKIILTGKLFRNSIFLGYLKSYVMEYQFEDFWSKVKVSKVENTPISSAILVINKLFYS